METDPFQNIWPDDWRPKSLTEVLRFLYPDAEKHSDPEDQAQQLQLEGFEEQGPS